VEREPEPWELGQMEQLPPVEQLQILSQILIIYWESKLSLKSGKMDQLLKKLGNGSKKKMQQVRVEIAVMLMLAREGVPVSDYLLVKKRILSALEN
jgi:hypothetical protein